MTGSSWNDAESAALLGAMATAARRGRDRALTSVEAGLIHGVRDHLLGTSTDLQNLPDVTPEQLAGAVVDDDHRAAAVQFLVLVPYADTTVEAPEVEQVDAYAAALGASPDTLRDLHQVRAGHIRRLMLDYGRRSLSHVDTGYGPLRSIVRFIHQQFGDHAVANRWAALADHPEGSLGRTFFVFYRDRGFPLPGEKHGTGEFLVGHDCTHILSGINTDGASELEVAGFEAGMFHDGFGYEMLLEVILDYHLGIDFGAGALGIEPKTGELDPDRVTSAIRRGSECTVNLLSGWDFWANAERPVAELRAEYHIAGDLPIEMAPPEFQRTDWARS